MNYSELFGVYIRIVYRFVEVLVINGGTYVKVGFE